MVEYQLEANICIECSPEIVDELRDALMDAMILVVEAYQAHLGGWINLKPHIEDDLNA